MPNYYIDTSALKWRYLNGNPTAYVNGIMDDPNSEVITSEFTMLEWSNALASVLKEHIIDFSTFKTNERALMTDIAGDRLFLSPFARSIEKARYLIEFIGALHRRSLRTGDSIHLISAIEISTVKRERYTFVTSDQRLASIIQDFDLFHAYLSPMYLAR
ncbi:MAG TPA: type II toxin-antitoxin system VapC family toxin [Blastocatellia bacterium]|nr:type II toxin-antitoxin system VapC family toxin [Blastocatellia bacterium]